MIEGAPAKSLCYRLLATVSLALASGCAFLQTDAGAMKRFLLAGEGHPSDVQAYIQRRKAGLMDQYGDGPWIQKVDAQIEDDAWKVVGRRPSVPAIRRFLDAFPEGVHKFDALELLKKTEIQAARDNPTPEAVSAVLEKYPETPLTPGMLDAVEELEFRNAKATDRGQLWELFIDKYPASERRAEAEQGRAKGLIEILTKLDDPLLYALAHAAVPTARDALPPVRSSTTTTGRRTQPFDAIRERAVAASPELRRRLCIKALSRRIRLGQVPADRLPDARKDIETLSVFPEATPPEDCISSPASLSPENREVLNSAYEKLVAITEEDPQASFILEQMELLQEEHERLLEGATRAVDDFEAQELTVETLFGKAMLDGPDKASSEARRALAQLNELKPELQSLRSWHAELRKRANDSQAFTVIAATLAADLEAQSR